MTITAPLARLTPREANLLRHILAGDTLAKAATAGHLSDGTASYTLAKTRRRLGITGTTPISQLRVRPGHPGGRTSPYHPKPSTVRYEP